MAFEPNYSKYSISELNQALDGIDGDKFPERVELIKNELASRDNEEAIEQEAGIKAISPALKNGISFLILLMIVLSILYSELVPVRGLDWITMRSYPKLYWLSVVIFSTWSCYYAKKFMEAKYN